MSNFARSNLLVTLICAAVASSLSSTAQATEPQPQAPARTKLDGHFSRYLESPGGEIDGIVLEDGTVARFAPLRRTPQAASFRPGDSVRVTGDVVSGVEGPYVVHASVTALDVPTTRGAVSPAPSASAGSGPRWRRAGKGAKSALKDSTQAPLTAGKPHGPLSAQSSTRTGKGNDLLVVDQSTVPAKKKGRLESIEARARDATTGKGNTGNYSQWKRAQETAGP